MLELVKGPSAVLDYACDWGSDDLDEDDRWLAEADTISSSSWVVEEGLAKDSDSHLAKVATVWLSGGTLGESYEVTNTIVSSGGRTDSRTFKIRIAVRQAAE